MSWRSRVAMWLIRSAGTDTIFKELFASSKSASNVIVNATTAQQSSAVFACVQVRSQDIAKLPVILYQRKADGSRRRAVEHPLYGLVGLRPNDRQTSLEYREMLQASLDLRGNAYSRITRDSRQRPKELIPLHNDWVQPVVSSDGTPFYKVRMYGRGKEETLSATDILHLRDRSDDGFIGKSCLTRARDVIGLDLAGQTHASKMYANGARPGGILIPKSSIGKDGRNLVRDEWNEEFQGVENTNKVFVAGQEFKYEAVGMTNVDAEFVNNRKLNRAEIAAIFRVPAHKIGIMDNATFSNIEHQSLEYVTDTLMPIARRWEQTLNVTLLREGEQAEYYFEFNFDALLRGDLKSRYEAYGIGRQWGWLSANDILKLENLNGIGTDGDEYLRPANMTLAGTPVADPNKAPPPTPAKLLHLAPPPEEGIAG